MLKKKLTYPMMSAAKNLSMRHSTLMNPKFIARANQYQFFNRPFSTSSDTVFKSKAYTNKQELQKTISWDKAFSNNKSYYAQLILLAVGIIAYTLYVTSEKPYNNVFNADENLDTVDLESEKLLHYLDWFFAYFLKGKFKESAYPLAKLAHILSENYEHHDLKRAIELLELGHYSKAELLFDRFFLHTNRDKSGIYYIIKGIIYFEFGDAERAIDLFDQALERLNKYDDTASKIARYITFYSKVIALKRLNHFEEAEKHLSSMKMLEYSLEQYPWNFINKYDELSCIIQYYINSASYKNPTIVRIWLKDKSSNRKYGHASLQTLKHYISFWPAKESSKKWYLNTIIEDIIDEFGLPDKRIVLQTLNNDLINREFEKIIESNISWNYLGSSIFRQKSTYNCSGLVGYLLVVSGAKGWHLFIRDIKNYFLYNYSFGIFILLVSKIPFMDKIWKNPNKYKYKAVSYIEANMFDKKIFFGVSIFLLLYIITGIAQYKIWSSIKNFFTKIIVRSPAHIGEIAEYMEEAEKTQKLSI
jgi:tetratricopeptide (TPR) repeat protein